MFPSKNFVKITSTYALVDQYTVITIFIAIFVQYHMMSAQTQTTSSVWVFNINELVSA